LELQKLYNPCIALLSIICVDQAEPFFCPPLIRTFFKSIRKAVCPAIGITPKVLWGYLRSYLNNGTTIDVMVSFINALFNMI
jgi:hypothetical protein